MSSLPLVPSSSAVQVGADARDIAARAKEDFNFLAALVMPNDFLFPFPAFYLTLFHLLTQFKQRVERFALGIPRGFAKTTWVKILCIWFVLFSHKHFILIIAASEKKSIAILADICDMLSSSNVRRVFGNWDANIEEDQAAMKVIHFRGREIILWAAGAGTSVRGIQRKMKRPDVMIMDDIQDREDAKNKELADALTTWMLSTLMKARSPFGCTYIFIGNMYPQNSLLEKLKHNRQWVSFVVGGITEDMKSLWEELKPIDELVAEYESDTEMGHPDVFISEVLNSTEIALASGIDIAQIPRVPEYFAAVEEGEGAFILIDPSANKPGGDECAIGQFEVKDGKPIFTTVELGLFSVTETVKEALDMGYRTNTRLICVEDVAYQSALLQRFEEYCEERGIEGFLFLPVSPRNQAKNARIKKGLIRLVKHEHYLGEDVRSLVISQIVDWNPLTVQNKDELLDLVGYTEEVMDKYQLEIIRQIYDTQADLATATHTADLELPY